MRDSSRWTQRPDIARESSPSDLLKTKRAERFGPAPIGYPMTDRLGGAARETRAHARGPETIDRPPGDIDEADAAGAEHEAQAVVRDRGRQGCGRDGKAVRVKREHRRIGRNPRPCDEAPSVEGQRRERGDALQVTRHESSPSACTPYSSSFAVANSKSFDHLALDDFGSEVLFHATARLLVPD